MGKGSTFRVVFNVIAIIVTILLSAATVLSYCAYFTDPSEMWWISFLGLGGQLLILANIVACAYWVVRMSLFAILPAVVMLAGVGFWGDFYQFKFSKTYQHEGVTGGLKIVTYNVKTFLATPTSFDRIAEFVNMNQADIVCFQEFGYNITHQDSVRIERHYSKYPFKTISSDLAIFSKFHLQSAKVVHFPNSTNNAMRVEVVIGDKTIALYNLHLQTTEFNQISGGSVKAIVDNENSSELARVTGQALKRNFIARVEQADSISKLALTEKIPVIVAGDFNDTPMSFVYSKIKGDVLDDAFKIAGDGYGYTYRNLMKLFRIDYVMSHREYFEVLKYDSPIMDCSDHNPVVVHLKLKQE